MYHFIVVKKEKTPVQVYLATSTVLFFLTLSAASSIGFVPDYFDGTQHLAYRADTNILPLARLPELGSESVTANDARSARGIEPERILIPSIGLDLPVQNPATRDIETLDTILERGPARYVDSAMLNETGNILIFAHSSHLPIVHNQMFRAFNRIPELNAGDTITLEGGSHNFVYRVTSVRKADTSEAIDLSAREKRLTLVTCDTLTGKSARWVAEAEFVGIL